MNSLKIFYLIVLFSVLILNSCQSENPVQPTEIKPVSLSKIDSIVVNSNNVIITATYITPNPCWKYYKTEIVGNDSIKTIKVFAKYDGEICIQILGSITRTDTIYFNKVGPKKLRFWLSDSLYKDTTIYFTANYKITFPDFFVEKGTDRDSSYFSIRGKKLNPYEFLIECTGWVKLGTGATLEKMEQPNKKVLFNLRAECGVGAINLWDKRTYTSKLTVVELDTINTIAYTNLYRYYHKKDTIYVRR